jgi:phosphatidylglycerol:prolipoprotein diacylglycerol transferase
VYPVLFRIGEFEVTSFGVMVAVGALVGLWILQRELARSGLSPRAGDAAAWGLLGGLAGAKLLWVFEHLGDAPAASLLFSRGGLSWYGGLAGGLGLGLFVLVRQRQPLIAVLAAATPALAIGHLLGRIGCFLVGDDYGVPSDLPWAVAFPQGLPPTTVPVHPTQLYEALALGVLAAVLFRWRRDRVADRIVLGRYLVLAGAIRFAIEFWRVNVRVALGLSVAHWASLAVIGSGVILFLAARRARGRGRM